MFSGWQTFYQLTGSAAGALIGLMFIVATLSGQQPNPSSPTGVKLFTTPVVFHLSVVLVVSALALTPGGEANLASLIMTGCAGVGLIYAGAVAMGFRGISSLPHWTDFWSYGAAPVAVYVALTVTAFETWRRAPHSAGMVGLVLLALLVLAIRNAWDLVTWLAPRTQPNAEPPAAS